MNSPVTGLIIAILLLLPHIFYLAYPPKQGAKRRRKPNPFFLVLERVGFLACILTLLLSGENFKNAEFSIFLGLWMVSLLLYLLLWIRYFANGRDTVYLSKPFLFFPVPSAVFSALTLLFTGIWIGSIPLCIAAAVYAVGHIFLTFHRTK